MGCLQKVTTEMLTEKTYFSVQICCKHRLAKNFSKYYGFGLSLDTRDSNTYVTRAKRMRCYAKTATFPRANFLERK